MEVDFGFLCDYADNPAKLNALGIGFDTIYASDVPTRHGQLYAVLRLRFTSVESGDRNFGLRVIDADGNELQAIDGSFRVEPPPPGATTTTNTLIVGLANLEFPAHGSYAIVWLVQGNETKRMPFRVAPPPTTA